MHQAVVNNLERSVNANAANADPLTMSYRGASTFASTTAKKSKQSNNLNRARSANRHTTVSRTETKGPRLANVQSKIGSRKGLDLQKLIQQANRLLANGKNQMVKDLVEKAFKSHEDLQQNPILQFQCGLANLNLSYLIIAQQSFEKALMLNADLASSFETADQSDPRLECLILTQLGYTYKMQDARESAIQAFVRVLELDSTPQIAGEVSKLYAKLGNVTMALEYATYAIEMGESEVLAIAPQDLSELYSQRVALYEAMNMFEHARKDQRKILEADPNFIQRQIIRQNIARETLEKGIKF